MVEHLTVNQKVIGSRPVRGAIIFINVLESINMKYVIADTHFGHSNIIKYCNRPFSSVAEMNDKLIGNWNKTIKHDDIVYHLGDVFFGKENSSIIHELNGTKHLIIGNHDNIRDRDILGGFSKILLNKNIFDSKGRQWHLTHMPIVVENNIINVHGHIHDKKINDNKHICVSVEHINYTPLNIDELHTLINH